MRPNENAKFIVFIKILISILLVMSYSGCYTTDQISGNSAIIGYVNDADTQVGLSDVLVTIQYYSVHVWTDETGFYNLTGILPGTYNIIFSKTGYTSGSLKVNEDNFVKGVSSVYLSAISPSKTIGKNGGTIVEKGVSLIIPKDALNSPTEISVTPTFDYINLDSSITDMFTPIFSVNLEPDGLMFNKPVTVVIPIPNELSALNNIPSDKMVIFIRNRYMEWEKVNTPVFIENNSLKISITHFTTETVAVDYNDYGFACDTPNWESRQPEVTYLFKQTEILGNPSAAGTSYPAQQNWSNPNKGINVNWPVLNFFVAREDGGLQQRVDRPKIDVPSNPPNGSYKVWVQLAGIIKDADIKWYVILFNIGEPDMRKIGPLDAKAVKYEYFCNTHVDPLTPSKGNSK